MITSKPVTLVKNQSRTPPVLKLMSFCTFLFLFSLSFGYNKRHSWRRFPHVKVFFYAKKNRGAIFFGVDRYASPLAWTYRPWRSRHSRRRFPHVRKKIYAKKKSRSDFFLASIVARHSCRRFPPARGNYIHEFFDDFRSYRPQDRSI